MNFSLIFMRRCWHSAGKPSWLLTIFLVMSGTSISNAAIIQFVIAGAGGAGLRSTNERTGAGAAATILGTPGSGGVTGAGIFYDDGGAVGATKTLTLNFSWTGIQGTTGGSTGAASGVHIHGPVTAGDPQLFNAGVLHNIIGNSSAANTTRVYNFVNNANGTGGLTNSTISWSGVTLPNFETDLLAGRLYLNVHSALNPGGEIRGNLVAVPEPTSLFLIGLSVTGLAIRKVRKFARARKQIAKS